MIFYNAKINIKVDSTKKTSTFILICFINFTFFFNFALYLRVPNFWCSFFLLSVALVTGI